MAGLFRPRITRYVNAEGKRCKKGDPGARKVKSKAKKWWGRYKDELGVKRQVPLSANRTAAQQMLAQIVQKAELAKVGIKDPFEAHRNRPLAEHLAEFEHELKTKTRRGRKKPPTAKQVRLKVGRISTLLEGCGFLLPGDIALDKVQAFLAKLSGEGQAQALEPEKESFTLAEVAQALGVKNSSVNPLVRRHGLEATGKGRARRFPRATLEVLLARQSTGMGASTVGYYAREAKSFTRWLAKRKRIPEDPLAELEGATVLSDHRHDRRPMSEEELRLLLAATLASADTYAVPLPPDRAAGRARGRAAPRHRDRRCFS
jgi:excisionase family DNA binding protein